MNKNNNEFDDPLLFDGDDDLAGPAVPQERAVSLAEVWHNNPSLKLFAVVAAVGLILIAFLAFGGDEKAEPSVAGGAQEFNETPGTAELPPAYEDAVREASENRAQIAEQTGSSAFPTPIGVPDRIEAPEQVEDTDPLAAWRREFEARQAAKAAELAAQKPEEKPVLDVSVETPMVAAPPPQPTFPPLPATPAPEDITRLSAAFAKQMEAVLASQAPVASTLIAQGIWPAFEKDKPTGGDNANNNQANATAATTAQAVPPTATKPPLIVAGQIAYAQMLTEANSDVPGPVLAEIASGPLAGARAIGSFQVAQDKLVLKFTRAIKDKKEYNINTIALDPATTLAGIASDVDRHYFSRIFIPAAAEFIKGFADAATQPNTTITVGAGGTVTTQQDRLDPEDELLAGAGTAGEKLAEVVEEDQKSAITVKVHTGTRMGLLFIDTLLDDVLPPGTPTFPTENTQGANALFDRFGNPLQQGGNTGLAPAPVATSVSGQPVQAAPVLPASGFRSNTTSNTTTTTR